MREDQLATFAELRNKASAGTLFMPHRRTEADSQEHEESDDEMTSVMSVKVPQVT